MNIAKSVSSHRHRFDYAVHWPALVEPIVPAKNLDSPMSKDVVSALLERERSVFPALAERRRPLDVASEEGFPGKIEPVGDRLNALASHHFPTRHLTVSQLSQVRLELSLRQAFAEELVVAILERYGMIPDLRRHVDRMVQVR